MGRKHKNARKRWPGPPGKKPGKELVYLHTRINGQHTIGISPRLQDLIEKTKGKPWVWKNSRISAITGEPFTEILEKTKTQQRGPAQPGPP